MTLIVKDKDSTQEKEKHTPALSLTHNELQGGAANGRNVSLLMKSDVELTEKQKEILKSLLGEETEFIEKMTYENTRELLSKAIVDKFQDNFGYGGYVYVHDFDESVAIMSKNDGLYSIGYTINGNSVTLDDEANPVTRIITYEPSTDSVMLSKARDGIDANVVDLIEKSLESINKNDKIKDILKSKQEEEEKTMQEEIQKALAPVQEELSKAQADLQKAVEERDALKAALADIEKAQAEAKAAKRLSEIKEVIVDEAQAGELQKSTASLDDEAFENILKALKTKQDIVENSEMFKQASGSGAKVEDSNPLADLLKSRYKKQ